VLRAPLSVWLLTGVLALGACTGDATSGIAPGGSAGTPSRPTEPPAPRIFSRYVALGDSYTAAPLVPEFDAAQGCFRSTRNYPTLVAAALEVTRFVDRSCTGAETSDLAGPQQTGVGPVRPQFAALGPTTDLVTLGIGGNDFSVFGTLVGQCARLRSVDPAGSPCRAAQAEGGRDRLLVALRRTQERVKGAIAEIEQRSPRATVLVVGYPQIVPADGSCPELLPLADGDLAYARRVNRALSTALERAAAAAGVGYVNVWSASAGHDICAADPWINGRFTNFSLAQAYHPFAAEQAAVAELIASTLGY
jgi:hypothetical protein